MNESESTKKYMCAYDLPQGVSRTFHRRLSEILDEFGGKLDHAATQSVYVFSGENALTTCYTIAVLAESFGAKEAYVTEIGEINPQTHFDEMAKARQIVANLTTNRRTKVGKLAPRSVASMADAESENNVIALTEVRQRRAKQSMAILDANEARQEMEAK